MTVHSIQERFFPENKCFGCGLRNEQGLGIRSFVKGDEVCAQWTPQEHHSNGFGFLCGGITATLLDCHTGAMAAWQIMQNFGEPISDHLYVTSSITVNFLRPTPMNTELQLVAIVLSFEGEEAQIHSTMFANEKKTAEAFAKWKRFKPRR